MIHRLLYGHWAQWEMRSNAGLGYGFQCKLCRRTRWKAIRLFFGRTVWR